MENVTSVNEPLAPQAVASKALGSSAASPAHPAPAHGHGHGHPPVRAMD